MLVTWQLIPLESPETDPRDWGQVEGHTQCDLVIVKVAGVIQYGEDHLDGHLSERGNQCGRDGVAGQTRVDVFGDA